MWVMIAGPWSSGARSPEDRERNARRLAHAALAVFRRGHVPVVGVHQALPLVEAAGGDADAIVLPLSLALAERCDAVVRLEGESSGADAEVARFRTRGCPVYRRPEDLPAAPPAGGGALSGP